MADRYAQTTAGKGLRGDQLYIPSEAKNLGVWPPRLGDVVTYAYPDQEGAPKREFYCGIASDGTRFFNVSEMTSRGPLQREPTPDELIQFVLVATSIPLRGEIRAILHDFAKPHLEALLLETQERIANIEMAQFSLEHPAQ